MVNLLVAPITRNVVFGVCAWVPLLGKLPCMPRELYRVTPNSSESNRKKIKNELELG